MKILLVQTSFLGDTILSTPVIAAITKKHPGAELWMMVTPLSKSLIERNPNIKGIIVHDKRGIHSGYAGFRHLVKDLKSHKFDLVYSLHRSPRTALTLWMTGIKHRIGFNTGIFSILYTERKIRDSKKHDVLRNLSLIEDSLHNEEDQDLKIYPEFTIQQIKEKFNIPNKYICVAPGSVWPTKQWHKDGYHEVILKLVKDGYNIVLVGGKNEIVVANQIADGVNTLNICGKTNISELVTLISGAQLLLCNDSMALHLGSAFKVPTIVMFCATSPDFGFGPWRNPNAQIMQVEGLWCRPCRRHGGTSCPTGTYDCMKKISAEQVYQSSLKYLEL